MADPDTRFDQEELAFDVRFKRGPKTVVIVHGMTRAFGAFKPGDLTERMLETEQYLERLTGLRVHIETAEDSEAWQTNVTFEQPA